MSTKTPETLGEEHRIFLTVHPTLDPLDGTGGTGRESEPRMDSEEFILVPTNRGKR